MRVSTFTCGSYLEFPIEFLNEAEEYISFIVFLILVLTFLAIKLFVGISNENTNTSKFSFNTGAFKNIFRVTVL